MWFVSLTKCAWQDVFLLSPRKEPRAIQVAILIRLAVEKQKLSNSKANMNKDSSPVQRLPKVTDGFNIRVAYCIFRPRNALLRCLLRVFYISHERSRALAGAKFSPRGKSWSRTRTISRRLAGAVKGIAMTSELPTYLRSRTPFIGAARHVQTCWYAFPDTL